MTKFECKDTEPFQADLKFKKPGKPQKKVKRLKSRIVRKIDKPKNTNCRFCKEQDDGTCCFRHSEDPDLKFLSGGGITGGKIHDQLSVWACQDCDVEMSTKPVLKHGDDMVLHAVRFREWQNKWKLGVITTWLI